MINSVKLKDYLIFFFGIIALITIDEFYVTFEEFLNLSESEQFDILY